MISTICQQYRGYTIFFQYSKGVVWSALKDGKVAAESTAKFPSEDGAFTAAKEYLDVLIDAGVNKP